MSSSYQPIHIPRRRLLRSVLRAIVFAVLALLVDLQIEGRENFPRSGPVLVVANHFSFLDPVVLIRVIARPVEFFGGFVNPAAPPWAKIFPQLWRIIPVFRGTVSRDALRDGQAVLEQGGVLVVMPEGGSWATVLRPARPGAAFLAARTDTRLLPVGLDGLTEVFPSLRRGCRARVTIRIGRPFGPFHAQGRGRERRRHLDEIGNEIMQRIAALIPPNRRGHFSDDPAVREAARGTEIYPWATATEQSFVPGEHLK